MGWKIDKLLTKKDAQTWKEYYKTGSGKLKDKAKDILVNAEAKGYKVIEGKNKKLIYLKPTKGYTSGALIKKYGYL